TYAALERGMEAYPDQPTVHDLQDVYHYHAIERGTRLIGVTGFGPHEAAVTAGLNAAFAQFGLPARCLPLGVGSLRLFGKVIDAVKLAGVVVDAEHQAALLSVAGGGLDESAQQAQAVDLLLHKGDGWLGHFTLARAARAALEETLRAKAASDR